MPSGKWRSFCLGLNVIQPFVWSSICCLWRPWSIARCCHVKREINNDCQQGRVMHRMKGALLMNLGKLDFFSFAIGAFCWCSISQYRCIIHEVYLCTCIHMTSRVSCQKGPTRHAYAWQIGPFWQDTLDVSVFADFTVCHLQHQLSTVFRCIL